MKPFAFLFILLLALSYTGYAQKGANFLAQTYEPGLSFVVMDTLHGAQSTVVEYPDFLVVMEMPMVDEGGGKSKNLDEDTLRAERFREFLWQRYPGKPVRYILSSHWHMHSLSGVTPFTRKGTKVVTTRSNWQYAIANGLIAPHNLGAVSKNVLLVTQDTLLLPKSSNPIRVLYLDSTYSHKPTKDYLFFFLTRQGYLHGSCMAALGASDLSRTESTVYSPRIIDFHRAITERNLPVKKVIRLGREKLANGVFEPGIYAFADVHSFIDNGKSPDAVLEPFMRMSCAQIRLQTDSILSVFMSNRLPPELLNAAVYQFIARKDYDKALVFAQLLTIYYPGDLDFMDTFGEAYYRRGDVVAAKRISKILLMRDPKWAYGFPEWEKNKAAAGK